LSNRKFLTICYDEIVDIIIYLNIVYGTDSLVNIDGFIRKQRRDYLGIHDLAIMLFVVKLPVILTELFLVYKEICLNWNSHANIFIYLEKIPTLPKFAISNIKKYIYFITKKVEGDFCRSRCPAYLK
jgi:hypothetical protein